jgi:hypothetical protein
VPNGGINEYGFDQTPQDTKDYAFFASEAKVLYEAFLAIVRGSASGDYTTSAPVSGAAVSNGTKVVLTSATYPGWQGHIRQLETHLGVTPIWDAGDVLTNPDTLNKPWQPTPATRALYTWDPTDGHLIPIDATNVGAIQALCGAPCVALNPPTGIDAAVVDFMRGNNGSGTKRPWLLGPSINVTPAVVGPAQNYLQSGNVKDHKPFEGLYKARRALTWLGADDGFLHAFDFGSESQPGDGSEVIGLLPPNLISRQIDLYKTFSSLSAQVRTDTGQNAGFLFDEHTWGVSNSLRFADVWFPACLPAGCYKTVGFLTEGPGGNLIAAIDITHPYPGRLSDTTDPKYLPPDKNYDPLKPVEVLWTKNASLVPDYTGLFGSWSVPAVAAIDDKTSRMTFGAGINPCSLYPGLPGTLPCPNPQVQQPANMFVADPLNGNLLSTTAIPFTSPVLVGQQTFTDSILFQTSASNFQNDNLADLAIQSDENGRLNAKWGDWTGTTSKVLIDLNLAAGGPQPLYYSAAANGIGTTGFQVYALGSGSFFEASPTVSGWNVHRTDDPPASSGFDASLPAFVPTLFIAVNPYAITDTANFAATSLVFPQVIRKVIGGATTCPLGGGGDDSPTDGICLQTTDPTFKVGEHERLGIHTQVTASPLLVTDVNSTIQSAFFTVFDPDIGCHGFSYVVALSFEINGGAPPTLRPNGVVNGVACSSTVDELGNPRTPNCGTTVYPAAAGAASGFVVTSEGAYIAQSGVGSGVSTLVPVDIPHPLLPGHPEIHKVWWEERK